MHRTLDRRANNWKPELQNIVIILDNTSVRSVITEHRLQYDHDFQWNNIKILDEEPCYRKRLISEMLNIKKQKNSLNLQTDTEDLHKVYILIVNKVWLFDTDSPSLLSICWSVSASVHYNRYTMSVLHICVPLNFIHSNGFSYLYGHTCLINLHMAFGEF